ncbi:MAG TPA: rhodanese-like domain-containing protein [Thermoanaerobaculia bacterium]|nr:rhodanese-like domain-containing protein [Thermoanaerobaculia bacterium]
MNVRNPFLQVALVIVAAAAISIVANAFAAPQRRLLLPGFWPNALRVPPRTTATTPPPVAAPATTTVQSPGPGQPPIVVPTTTIERPAGTTAATATVPPATAGVPAPQPPTTATAAPAPAPVPPAPAADSLARFAPHPDKAYVEIGGDDVAALYRGGALFLDARRTSVYEEGHIAGARPFSVWEADIDEKVNALFNERSDPAEQNKPIVIYCSGGACEDSHMLAEKLWGIQFNNVYVYKDGFPDWQKRGGPVKTGATP